jgi:membrane protein implicated in regulation of membrane protease activity
METITNYVSTMGFIDWGIPAIIFLALRFTFIKSEILKWAGGGAVIVAIISLVKPDIGWQVQWLTFLIFTVIGLYLNRGAKV